MKPIFKNFSCLIETVGCGNIEKILLMLFAQYLVGELKANIQPLDLLIRVTTCLGGQLVI